MNARIARLLTSFLIILMIASGCAPQTTPSSPLANRELTDSTEIYLDSDQYYLQAADASGENSVTPNGVVLQRENRDEEKPKPKPKLKTKTKVKTRAKPIDVEFILTRSKDIAVGLATDGAGARVQNDAKFFIPASITKVLTTAIALRGLGEDFKFKTQIVFDLSSTGQASNVVVMADGDPTSGIVTFQAGAPERMKDIARALHERGVREILGPVTLVSADPRMDTTSYATGIPFEDMSECYGSLATSFNFRQNCARVRVSSKTGFAWEGTGVAPFIETILETSATGSTRLALEPLLSAERLFLGFKLRGTYNAKAPRVMQLRLPIGNGASWYGQGLLAAFRDFRIVLNKVSVKFVQNPGERDAALAELSRHRATSVLIESVPLSSIVEATNKPSDNFFADSLFKAIGTRLGDRGGNLMQVSRAKVKEALDGWLRMDGHGSWSDDLLFNEGAGLSQENRATPRAFLALLRQISRERTFPALWNSLPIAGVDGTLGDRMRETIAAGKVRGKTGTLNGSYQLVGFIPKVRGATTEYVPFVILTSTTNRNRDLVRKFQDALVVKMVSDLARD